MLLFSRSPAREALARRSVLQPQNTSKESLKLLIRSIYAIFGVPACQERIIFSRGMTLLLFSEIRIKDFSEKIPIA